jgi:hypothetical protein
MAQDNAGTFRVSKNGVLILSGGRRPAKPPGTVGPAPSSVPSAITVLLGSLKSRLSAPAKDQA